jgi:hypothetical protein
LESAAVRGNSTFVTVLAWILIVFAGFGTFMGVAQIIMVQFMPSMPVRSDAGFIEQNFRLLFLVPLVVSIMVLVASIGLLKRREWARKTIIGVMSIGVLYSAGSLVAMWLFGFGTPPAPPPGTSAEMRQTMLEMNSFAVGVRITTTIFALAVAALMTWVVYRLVQPETCEEFAV